MTSAEMSKLYETVLCIPGMSENVKLNLSVSRKLVLLLSQVIEIGFQSKENGGALSFFPEEAGSELKAVINELLEKAGLNDLNSRLKNFHLK